MDTVSKPDTVWPMKYNGPCACRFVREEEFGETKQVEWCGLHAKQQDAIAAGRVTQEMLNAGMKKAVELGLVQKHMDPDAYIKTWDAMKACLQAALDAA